MTAQIWAEGLDLFGDPLPELLADVAGLHPQPGSEWVNLEERRRFRSTRRLWIGDFSGGDVAATWPAELAPQARYLYGRGLGSALVAAAIERCRQALLIPIVRYGGCAIYRTQTI